MAARPAALPPWLPVLAYKVSPMSARGARSERPTTPKMTWLSDGSTGPAPGNQQRQLGPKFHPPSRSPTSSPTACSRNRPSQQQAVAITQSPPSRSLAGCSTDLAPGNLQPPVLGSYPTSLTNPRTASRRNSARVPSQPQDVAITQLPLGSPYGSIDPMMLDDPVGYLDYGGFI